MDSDHIAVIMHNRDKDAVIVRINRHKGIDVSELRKHLDIPNDISDDDLHPSLPTAFDRLVADDDGGE